MTDAKCRNPSWKRSLLLCAGSWRLLEGDGTGKHLNNHVRSRVFSPGEGKTQLLSINFVEVMDSITHSESLRTVLVRLVKDLEYLVGRSNSDDDLLASHS